MGKIERKRTKILDNLLLETRKKHQRAMPVTILGMKNSGKSTLLKQLDFIYNDKFSGNLDQYKTIIVDNVYSSLSTLCMFIHNNKLKVSKKTFNELDFQLQQEIKNKSKIEILGERLYYEESVHDKFKENQQEFTREIFFLNQLNEILSENFVPDRMHIFYASFPKRNSICSFEVSHSCYNVAVLPNSVSMAENFSCVETIPVFGLDDNATRTINRTKIIYFIDMLSLTYKIEENSIVWDETQTFHDDFRKFYATGLLEESIVFFTKYDLFESKIRKQGFNLRELKYSTPPMPEKCSIASHFVCIVDPDNLKHVWNCIRDMSLRRRG